MSAARPSRSWSSGPDGRSKDSVASRLRARVSRAAMVGVPDQEEPGDVGGRDAEHQPQGERGGRLRREGGVRAEQDQPQPLVVHHLAGIGHDALRLLGQVGLDRQQRQLACGHRLRAQPVEDASPGRGEQPGGWVGRDAVARPGAGGRLEGVGQAVLGQVEAPVLGDEQGQQPAPLVAPGGRQRGLGARGRPRRRGRRSR